MIELRTLGSLDLVAPQRPAASGVLTQPKRCAVLVYLAASAPRGFVRRDTLLALFWPDTDQARGRNVLRQTVYQLRQCLGADAIRGRGDEELGVDSAVVSCDVTRLEDLLASGRTVEALELYRGDFLSGFHVPDAAPELEEWMQSEARRLRGLATGAAWSVAQAEEQRGNAGGAVHWARRVLTLDPLNEKRLGEAMQLMARAGDRVGALQVYQAYARRADEEFGMEPASSVQQLAKSLRSEQVPLHQAVTPAPIDESGRAPVPPTAPATQRSNRVSFRRSRLLAWSVPAIALIALGAVLEHRVRPAVGEPVIAIGQITDSSPGDSEHQSNVAAGLLSTSLARLHGMQVLPLARVKDVQTQLRAAYRPDTSALAAARQLGAAYLIDGSVHRDSTGGLQLDLQVLDARTGSVARVERANGSDLFTAIDRATTSIAVAFDLRTPRESIKQVTTTSLVAYRLYDQGLQAYYAEDRSAAHRLFMAALAEDSALAMAAYYAALSTANVPERNALLRRATSLANRATDLERLLIVEGAAQVGMSASFSALADTMAVRYPLDPDAQSAFGHVLLRRGDFLGAARQYRRVITMDSLSLHRAERCVACDAYGNLAWSYLFADSAGAAERVLRELASARPGVNSFSALAMALARQDRFAEARRALQAADSAHPGTIDIEFYGITLDLREGAFADADTRLRHLLRSGNQQIREQAVWYLVLSLRTQGRLHEALALADQLPGQVARPILLLEIGRSREAAQAFQALVGYMDTTSLPGHRAKHQAWSLTHVATSVAAAGDTSRLEALADSVERLGRLSAMGRDPRLHHYIRGLLWKARRQTARAADEFRKSIWSWSDGFTRANYELARALIALNKPAEALYPLQSALRGDLESSNLYVSRTELHELLAEAFDQLGRRDSAIVHYRRVTNAWSKCDSLLLPVSAARGRLTALESSER